MLVLLFGSTSTAVLAGRPDSKGVEDLMAGHGQNCPQVEYGKPLQILLLMPHEGCKWLLTGNGSRHKMVSIHLNTNLSMIDIS